MAGQLPYVGLCVVLPLLTMQVSGLSFTVSRDKVVKGNTGTQQFNCGITESNVDSVFLIQIVRETKPGSGVTEVLAEMKASETTPTMKVTGEYKGFVAGGTWDGANTFLTLDMDTTKIQCNDARAYSCDLTYLSTGVQSVKVQQNSTFLFFVNPSMTSLDATRNGMFAANSSMFDVGDLLELTCRANIGSFSHTKIEWERSSETSGSLDEFKGYTPPPLTFTDGDPLNDNQCGYTRTATITYNVTAADANRENNLAFRCFVSVSGDPYGTYTTQNNPSFYVKVTKDESPITSEPEVPKIDRQSNSNSPTSILVIWEKPSDVGSEILDYKITSQRVNVKKTQSVDSMKGDKSETKFGNEQVIDGIKNSPYTIRHLIHGTYYEIKVYARNAEGHSLPGVIVIRTQIGEPEVPKIDRQSNSNSPTSILVIWEKPSDGGSEILDYKITYQRVNVKKTHSVDSMKGDKSETKFGNEQVIDGIKDSPYTIRHLIHGTYYEIKVYARNAEGHSLPGVIVIRTQIGDKEHKGDITQGAVGGVVAVLVIIAVVLVILFARKMILKSATEERQ